MLRVSLFAAAAVWAAGASGANAQACDFQATVAVVDQEIPVHECWDLSAWPAAKAQSFCETYLGQQPGVVQVRPVAACPAQKVAQCKAAKFRSPSAASMPEAYFAKMPKEMADQIKARMNANNPLRAYDGLESTINYYRPAQSPITLADQQADCEQGKQGRFQPGG